MNCNELYVSHAENGQYKFRDLLSYQADPLTPEKALEWLMSTLSKPSTIGSIFDRYFDYQKLIYIYFKYGDDETIKPKCEIIFNTIRHAYEQKLQYLSRMELKELPLSE